MEDLKLLCLLQRGSPLKLALDVVNGQLMLSCQGILLVSFKKEASHVRRDQSRCKWGSRGKGGKGERETRGRREVLENILIKM